MSAEVVLGFTQEREGRSYARRKDRMSHIMAVYARKREGSRDELGADALGFPFAGNGETNGHM